ncbi:MAG TPA: cupredoxin domain-containing protein [Terriglobia bacterium]|nr:cupredoxin domain-containing protein [Terriglobia bacterium]
MIRSNTQRVFICVGIALLLLCGVRAQAQASVQGNARAIQITAKEFEFTPNVIEVKKGDHVKLTITALDRDHGIALPAFGIKQRLKKGVPTVIEFDANKTGTFPFHCSVFCGMGHRHMKGAVVVKEN